LFRPNEHASRFIFPICVRFRSENEDIYMKVDLGMGLPGASHRRFGHMKRAQ